MARAHPAQPRTPTNDLIDNRVKGQLPQAPALIETLAVRRVAPGSTRRYDRPVPFATCLAMQQWKKLVILIVVSLALVSVAVTWSTVRRRNTPPAPALLPGTVIQPVIR